MRFIPTSAIRTQDYLSTTPSQLAIGFAIHCVCLAFRKLSSLWPENIALNAPINRGER